MPKSIETRTGASAGQRHRLVDAESHGYLMEGYRGSLPLPENTETRLAGVVEDTLRHPGSLVRAQLVFGLATDLGVDREVARSAAIAVEYFHCASLIFDDMPSMDDASVRRGRPCPHRVYGEAAATLGALSFINQGYSLLWWAIGGLPAERSQRAARLVAESLGPLGLLNGQALDLQFRRSARTEKEVLEIAEGKTVPLVRLTLLLPALLAGIGPEACASLDRLAVEWGLAYQIADDFKDCLMSKSETGKTTAQDRALGRPNLPDRIGLEGALDRLDGLLAGARVTLAGLGRADVPLAHLLPLQALFERERGGIATRLEEVAPPEREAWVA